MEATEKSPLLTSRYLLERLRRLASNDDEFRNRKTDVFRRQLPRLVLTNMVVDASLQTRRTCHVGDRPILEHVFNKVVTLSQAAVPQGITMEAFARYNPLDTALGNTLCTETTSFDAKITTAERTLSVCKTTIYSDANANVLYQACECRLDAHPTVQPVASPIAQAADPVFSSLTAALEAEREDRDLLAAHELVSWFEHQAIRSDSIQ